jgi:hypothetical protein
MSKTGNRPNPAASYRWRRISRAQIDNWNETLLHTAGSYCQYPFWTEPYRRMGFRPVYLSYENGSVPTAYVCIQSLGIPGFRIGIVQNGPVSLQADAPIDDKMLRSLATWARRAGYMFVKFSHRNPDILRSIVSLPSGKAVNPFPFFGAINEGLVVPLRESEDEMLASFQPVARYEIRTATRAGYEIRAAATPQDFTDIWPMIERLSERKGFHVYRPLAGWCDMLAGALPHKCAHVYTARIDGKIVQAILIVRDGRTSEYMLGALDVEALGGRPSPACLLHWRAMRDAYAFGCTAYDLGPPSGPVFQFKRKFRPTADNPASPVTLATSRIRYWLWTKLILRTAVPLWPRFRSLLTKVLRRS